MTADLDANLSLALDTETAGRAIADLWPDDWGPRPDHLAVARVHFSGKRPPVVQYRAESRNASRTILAEIVDAAADHAEAEAVRIRRSGASGRLVAAPALGLVARLPGTDAKLPGLALVAAAGRAADLLSSHLGPTDWSRPPTIRLRAHRLARRAVLEITPANGAPPVFARLAPTSRGGGLGAFQLHQRIDAQLKNAEILTTPRPLFHAADLGAAFYSAISADPLDLTDPGASVGVAQAMLALGELRAFGPRDVPAHDVARELALLTDWAARIDRYLPTLANLHGEAFAAVAECLATPEADLEPCHRDFHEGQVMTVGERTGLLDFDTYRLGDRALDPGNLIAHIRLAELRSGRSLQSLIDAVLSQSTDMDRRRIAAWTRAALLRLGCIYAFTTDNARHAPQLLRDARDGLNK